MSESLPRKIVISQAIKERMISLGKQAIKCGQFESYCRAWQTIQKRLETLPLPPSEDPNVFGDPRFRFSQLDLLACVAIVEPVSICFGVALHPQGLESAPFVGIYVISVEFMPKREPA
jgi:hypothetical protein